MAISFPNRKPTPSELERLRRNCRELIDLSMSTERCDRPAAEKAVRELYRAYSYGDPIIVWCASPQAAVRNMQLYTRYATKRFIPTRLLTRAHPELNSVLEQLPKMRRANLPSLDNSTTAGFRAEFLNLAANKMKYHSAWTWDEHAPTELYAHATAEFRSKIENISAYRRALYQFIYDRYYFPQMLIDMHALLDSWLRIAVSTVWTQPHNPPQLTDLFSDVYRSVHAWWPSQGIVFVSDRPTVFNLDAQQRLHCEDGVALGYSDGFGVWSWHGQTVPKNLILGLWTPRDILHMPNIEVRRCALERMGWEWFIREANLAPIGESMPDPGNPGQTITLYQAPENLYRTPVRLLVCTNGTVERDGTRRTFGLTVPGWILTPLEAAAWIHHDPTHPLAISDEVYATLQRRC